MLENVLNEYSKS